MKKRAHSGYKLKKVYSITIETTPALRCDRHAA
ncbi:Uncharacterised protein [Vibrio cholerae]|nr:Uncharacterised protein [Vibrio cholerae]